MDTKTKGWIYFTLWAVLIVAGIVGKRVYGYPNLVPFFHLPAAVFLVMAGHCLSEPFRRESQLRYAQFKARTAATSTSGGRG